MMIDLGYIKNLHGGHFCKTQNDHQEAEEVADDCRMSVKVESTADDWYTDTSQSLHQFRLLQWHRCYFCSDVNINSTDRVSS